MRLCLFIGHHKVGSTALQAFLWRNAARLLRAGILYPTVESEGHALMLRQALGDGAEAPFNAREAHNALAFRMLHERLAQPVPPWHPNLPSVHQMFVAIRNQLRYHQPRAVILCAEAFANFGPQAPELIAELTGLFPAAEVSLHAIFRRPDQYLVAWHGQRLRFGHRVPPLGSAGLRLYEGTIHLDCKALLAPWCAALPSARLSLRNYDDVVAAGGTVRDFLAEAALGPLPPLLPEQRMNGSIHPALMEFARRANHVLPAPENVRFCEFLAEISPRIAVPDRREVELLGANRARLVEAVTPGLDWLDALTRGRFFPDAAAMRSHLPVPEVEANARVLPLLAAELRAAGRSEGLLPRLLEEA